MQTIHATRLRIFFATVAAATLCAAVSGSAHAEDKDKSNSSWTINIGFGNHVGFGNNRTRGSGVVAEETRAVVANFSRLVLALPATVTLSQGAADSLTISADDNLLPLLSTRVVGDELIIDADKNRGFSTKHDIKIRLTVKSLNAVAVNGSGDVVGDQMKSDKFDIAINGSGDVKFKSIRADQVKVSIEGSGDVGIDELAGKSVDASIRGSGDIKLPSVQATQVNISVHGSGDVSAAGVTDKVDVEIKGSGDVRTRKLVAREADVKIMSSGDAEVHAREKLTASVFGSGDVRYAGSPANINRTVRGSGSIEAL